jgi:hypothetical protein
MTRSALSVEWEPIDKLLAHGLEDLAAAHWEEAESARRRTPLDLDFAQARMFEKSGHFKIAALRRTYELIGYASFMLISPMLYASTASAFCTAIYVDLGHRGFASMAFLPMCEGMLCDLGVVELHIAAKTQRQRDLLEKQGYVLTETMHAKRLETSHVERHRAHALPAA